MAQDGGSNAVELVGLPLEQVDGPPYTFLRLATNSGEKWVAIPIARIARDRPVKVTGAVPLRDFEIEPGRRVEVLY